MNILSHHHCYFKLIYHLVLVTKYREKCLSPAILSHLNELIKNHFETANLFLLQFKGKPDHIQLTFSGHPNIELSRFIGNVKTVTSRLIRKHHNEHLKQFNITPHLWTRAYGLFSSGEPHTDDIQNYIKNQGLDRRYTLPTKRKRT